MLTFEPVKTNPDKWAVMSEDGRIATLLKLEDTWHLVNIYNYGLGVVSLKLIRRKLKELNNA